MTNLVPQILAPEKGR